MTIPDYGSVEGMLRTAAWRAARRYHAEEMEMFSLACMIYVRAIRSYRPNRGTFKRHLRFRLRRLTDAVRTAAHRNRILPRDVGANLAAVASRTRFNAIFAELGPDAHHVAKLAIASRGGLRPIEVRRMLKQYLLAKGWDRNRIAQTFLEIQEAVS